MYVKISWPIAVIISVAATFSSCQKDTLTNKDELQSKNSRTENINEKPANIATVTIIATGLNNPRGLEFGPDGNLYVAEAGTGGTNSTVGLCTQVAFPVGPYLGSPTGAGISKINSDYIRTVLTDQLPSSNANEIIGGDVEGVSDIAFIGNTMYALLAGAGCSHGVPSVPNGIIKVNSDGSWTLIADISSWLQTHPVLNPSEGDFEPDGTAYSMISLRGDLYVIEPNHGDMIKVTTSGDITRVVDISATQGHIVPTALAYHGNFYVGNLNTFPIQEGSSNIYKITPSGEIKVWATGFTTILGLAFDNNGRLYVLENTTGAGNLFPTPNTGKIIRVDPSGAKETIATGLSLPTGMTYGPDGNLYVSNVGFSPLAIGGGQVLKVELN
jgi:hypothetical protein